MSCGHVGARWQGVGTQVPTKEGGAMEVFICVACGTSYPPSASPPARCLICDDVRQFVPETGQSWITPGQLASARHNVFRRHEPRIIGVGSQPKFGIGQRAVLVRTARGNILWDCISLIDEATIAVIEGLGGLDAIAISHPHFYSTMGDWSRAFGDVPIYLHAADREWIARPEPAVELWDGDRFSLMPDVTLIRAGGHFPGSSMLHWADGADGRGAVLTSDTATITADRKSFTFMRSFPNFLPLSGREVERIQESLAPFDFEAAYGHFFDRAIPSGAKEIFRSSVERYLEAISETTPRGGREV